MRLYPRMLYRVGKLQDCKPTVHQHNIFWSLAIDETEQMAMLDKYGFHLTVAEAVAERDGVTAPKPVDVDDEPQAKAPAAVVEPPQEQPKRRGRPPKARGQ